MTLIMIVVAALSLAGLSRRSLLLANDSIAAQRELQRYWGANSCRRLLLDQAEDIFAELEQAHVDGELPWPAPNQVVAETELGGMTFRLRLSDEEAKLNLNSVTASFESQRNRIIGQLVSPGATIQLEPDTSPSAKERKGWFSSWGQVVDIRQLEQTNRSDSLMDVASKLTCWGNGKLNFHRVDDPTLLLICSKLVNRKVGQKIIEARNEPGKQDSAKIVNQLALKRGDKSKLTSWLSDRSTCYCLWLEVDDGQRRWYYQWISGDPSSTATKPYLSFRW